MAERNTQKHQYKDTLNLPRTDFPIRAHSKENDPKMVARWQDEQLYARAMACNEGNQQFILHDGPPYANGHIHLGHAYNKILKDIITKSRRMMGFHVPVVPGWDCHGLPIEQKVASEQPELSGQALKQACRDYALRWIDTQREEFKRLGVLMDWQQPYVTMSYAYEAKTIEAFARLYNDGYVTRKNKTVSWCPHCHTVLAAAEIEYDERKDPSTYLLFPFADSPLATYVPEDKPMAVVIWTTTPWTIPLNRAVAVRPDTEYAIVDDGHRYLVVAKALVETVCGEDAQVVATFNSNELEEASLTHPITHRKTPILLDDIADVSEGTGAVHIAPGCGPIDYEVAVKHGLEVYSPITPEGYYAQEIQPHELAGKPISDGTSWVLRYLKEHDYLFAKHSYTHKYPHCWRCHKPLIFRATPQWFINVTEHELKSRALDAIHGIQFAPPQGKNFLYATVENRWEWCVSRQRVWGVPIPALLSKHGDPAYTSATFMQSVAEKVAQHGIEYWDAATPEKLVEDGLLPADFPVHDYYCETDILDVWFDAGVSHFAVLDAWPQLNVPADLYLEGVDQHRGWFQSSLFTGMAMHDQPPMRGIMTHGFTVDAQGYKMSKSRGNVVSPQDMMDRIGTDGLRLWVASIGHEGDAVVSDDVLTNVTQVYRKIRNTARFLLQNLYDFDIHADSVTFDAMLPVDQYAMQKLYDLNKRIIEYYESGHVSAIFHDLADYVASELSAFYMDVVKDRLYCDHPESVRRRSAQTVFWMILDTMTRLTAPILSFTAEQIADHYQGSEHPSIHLQRFNSLEAVWNIFAKQYAHEYETGKAFPGPYRPHFVTQDHVRASEHWFEQLDVWSHILVLRDVVLKAIEEQREQGVIRHPLEACVTLHVGHDAAMYDYIQRFEKICEQSGISMRKVLQEIFVVSQVVWSDDTQHLQETEQTGVYVDVSHAQGEKCPRCWHWAPEVATHGLCERCRTVVSKISDQA